ncbi:MAG: hypothetical protein QOC92_269 [Acidimicrobiaceae bacterium]|jgi:hypothetical protein
MGGVEHVGALAVRRRRSRTWCVIGTVFIVGAVCVVFGATPPRSAAGASATGADLGPGCDATRPAVAHHAGGEVLDPQPPGGPIPCTVSTGFAAAESHIVVTNRGTVVYTPAVVPSGLIGTGQGPGVAPDTDANASPAAIAVTNDDGSQWSLVKPLGVTWNPTDHADYVDPVTGRLFYENYGPIPLAPSIGPEQDGPSHILWSDDDGQTWHHTVLPALTLTENPRFTSAPPVGGQPPPVGYPDVIYFCANTNVGFTSPVIVGRLCYRSLDGGTTFTQSSQLFNAAVAQHPECGTDGENFSAVDGYYPEPAHDGSLFVLVSCGAKTFLARSIDEGSSFPVVRDGSGNPVEVSVPTDSITTAIGSGPHLRIDSDDNMYLIYPEITGRTLTKLFLQVSDDHGLSWTAPLELTAPGVTGVLRWAVAAREPGHVAVAYLGQRDGQSTFDGYLTETRDALDALQPDGHPKFWSAVMNDPAQPLMFGRTIKGAGFIDAGGVLQLPYLFPLGIQPITEDATAGFDFIGATIGPDGTPWAGFARDCGPAPDTPSCTEQNDQTRGVAARFAYATQTPESTAGRLPATGLADGGQQWIAVGILALAVLAAATSARSPARRP